MPDRTITELDEAESLKLISPGGIGRIAYQSRFGPAVLAEEAGVEPWPPGKRELFPRIVPHRVTGRRIQPA
jgi:hypothetical protein